jgi:flagellar motor switch protein FliN/FliY
MSDDTATTTPEPIAPSAGSRDGKGTPLFSNLPVEITVSVGKARPTISALLDLRADSVVPLDKGIEDLVDVLVGDKLIARGTLEEIVENGQRQLAVRLTSVPGLGSA